MSVRYTVVLTTLFKDDPELSSTALRFSSTRSVCAAMSPSTILPVAGSRGIWPLRKAKPFETTAWEYGPIAAGALGVETIFITLGCRRVYSRARCLPVAESHPVRGRYELEPKDPRSSR